MVLFLTWLGADTPIWYVFMYVIIVRTVFYFLIIGGMVCLHRAACGGNSSSDGHRASGRRNHLLAAHVDSYFVCTYLFADFEGLFESVVYSLPLFSFYYFFI